MYKYKSLFSFSFDFAPWSAGTIESTILQGLFFLLFATKYGRQLSLDRTKEAKSIKDQLSRVVAGGTP